MRVVVDIQKEAVPILQRMAKDAGLGLRDMVEIGAYNLVALWLREHDEAQPLDTPQHVDVAH